MRKNVTLQVPRFDTPTCHPHHALTQMVECTISAKVVVTNTMGAVNAVVICEMYVPADGKNPL